MRISRIRRVQDFLSCVELLGSVCKGFMFAWTTYDFGFLPSADFLSLLDKRL